MTQYVPHGTFLTPVAGILGRPKILDAVSGTDLRFCAKFQPNQFSSFGEDHASQTDRQTAMGARRDGQGGLALPWKM